MTVPLSPIDVEFPPDQLLIFIGHSDDAKAEAEAILALESRTEREFQLLLKSNRRRSPFRRSRLWEWRDSALPISGGQEAVVTPTLDRAQIAIFVFKERVGKVTWDELQKVRERSRNQRLYILAFFPAYMPPTINTRNKEAIDNWSQLLKCSDELTQDWTDQNGVAVTPCPTYQSIEELKTIVLDKLKVAMADILAVESPERHPTPSPKVDAASHLHRYQATLMRQLGNITLTGSPALEHFATKLSETFVSLSLSGSVRAETRFCKGVEPCELMSDSQSRTPEQVMSIVFQQHPLLLIIGDPGSGKTTLLKHYALSCLDEQRYRDFGFSERVNLFFLPLRELNIGASGDISLAENLAAWSKKQFLTIEAAHFSDWLDQPSTLVLLDGLDEISDVSTRMATCKWIHRTVDRFTKAKFVVTSRSTGYRKGDGIEIEAGHLRADIMDFSLKQQAEFLQRWFKAAFCGELPPAGDQAVWRSEQKQKAATKADAILAFLALEKNRSLRPLAGVPLLLQIMAMLWKEREYLPSSRLELYDAALNYLLDFRDRRRGLYPKLSAQDARRVLSPVSLFMQEELKKDEVDRQKMQQKMQVQLDTLYNSLPASDFCRNLVDRAGLLVEYGDNEYVFRHKSFREYMAGVQLVKNMHHPDALDKLVLHFGDDWWTEVFRFFIAHVDDAALFDSFMQKLFDSSVTDELTQKEQDLLVTLVDEAPQKKIDALKQKLLVPETTVNRQRYLVACLNVIGKPDALAVVEEFKRFELSKGKRATGVKYDPLGAQYIRIPAGKFIYSETEKPEKVNECYFAKCTVTNQQYRRFISYLAGKEAEFQERVSVATYEEQLRQMASAIDGFSGYLKEEARLSKRFISEEDTNKRFNKDEQPVVGVSWYAARAYCLWLSLLASNGEYRLPMDAEWEWAAGGQRDKADKVLKIREYPWIGKEISSQHANYDGNEGVTTPVGRYPKGATPEGLYDMAGNVWEWIEDWSNKETRSSRVLRGGSWSNIAGSCRSANRSRGTPGTRCGNVGFRLVFVP